METLALVRDVLSSQLRIDSAEIRDTSNLTADLGIDSVEALDLLFALEARFNVKLPDDSIDQLKTVADVAALIEQHRKVA